MVTFNFDQDSASNPWPDDASGSGMQTVSTSILVTIIDDDVLEGNEQLYIALETRDTSVDLSLMNTTSSVNTHITRFSVSSPQQRR